MTETMLSLFPDCAEKYQNGPKIKSVEENI